MASYALPAGRIPQDGPRQACNLTPDSGPPGGGRVSSSHDCKVQVSQALEVQTSQRREQAALELTLSRAFIAALTATACTQGKRIGSLCSQGTGSGTRAGQESSPQGWQFVLAVAGSSEPPRHVSSRRGQARLIKPIWKEPPAPPRSSARLRRGAL